ncbi:MAG: hypothetical protein KKG92_01180 [Gammaproteobacteria bacterium]|nr:hypothetical protein [Gammaproteobacteria bacterium]
MNFPSIVSARTGPYTFAVSLFSTGEYALDYLDVAVMHDQEWFDAARHGKTRVIALGGKGRNAILSLSRWLPPGIDLLLQTNDEQGRLLTKRYAGAANELEDGDALITLPGPTDFEAETLFIWAGLGGQFGTLHSQTLACDDRNKNIPIFALVTLPFAFEGERAERAEKSRKALEKNTEGCFALRNEALIEIFGGEADLAKVFTLQDQWLAHALLTIKGLADTQSIRPLVSQTGLGYRLNMGFGRSTGTNRVDQAVTAAFSSPLLQGMNKHSHHAVVVLCSSKVPSETEMEQARKLTAYAFTSDCKVTVHALCDPRMGDDLYATIFLFDRESPDSGKPHS